MNKAQQLDIAKQFCRSHFFITREPELVRQSDGLIVLYYDRVKSVDYQDSFDAACRNIGPYDHCYNSPGFTRKLWKLGEGRCVYLGYFPNSDHVYVEFFDRWSPDLNEQ